MGKLSEYLQRKTTLNKKALLPLIFIMSGCTIQSIHEQSDYELCGNAAQAIRYGNTSDYFAIKSEMTRRKTLRILHITKEDCDMAGALAIANDTDLHNKIVTISNHLEVEGERIKQRHEMMLGASSQ